jgi:hypothetical protein
MQAILMDTMSLKDFSNILFIEAMPFQQKTAVLQVMTECGKIGMKDDDMINIWSCLGMVFFAPSDEKEENFRKWIRLSAGHKGT